MSSKNDIIILLEKVLQSNTSRLSKEDKKNIEKALIQANAEKRNDTDPNTGKSYWDAIYVILRILGIGSDFFD